MYFEWESLRFKLTRHDTFVAKQVDANDCAVNPDHDYIRLRDGNWRKRGYGAVSPEFIRVLDRQVAAYISLTAPRKFAPFNGHRTRTSPNSERPQAPGTGSTCPPSGRQNTGPPCSAADTPDAA